jgi:hypothetical protein
VERRDVESFIERDWDRAAASKRRYWAERFEREGWQSVWHAAQALVARVRRVRPDYPTEADRELDLYHHHRLRDVLDRSADAFTRR